MPIVDAPLIIRLYEAIGLSFPPGAPHMPSLDATVPLPNCLLCGGHASPPSTMGWLSASGDQRAFSICSNCGWDCDDAELEQKIHQMINLHRQSNDRQALVWDQALANVARAHSAAMAKRLTFDLGATEGRAAA